MKSRLRLAATALAVAGVLFVLYPAIRPFSDETSLQGAAAFASTSWLVAHMLAMVGFTLAALGLLGLYLAVRDSPVEPLALWTLVVFWIGVGLTLPFYGGEAFGLHAIGQEALKQHSTELVALAAVVRGGPELVMFLIGLLLLGAGSILAAITIWRFDRFQRWSGIPFAAAFALYIPQFFGTQPIRVAHGLLVTIGCGWIAVGLWREATASGPRPAFRSL